MQTSQESKARNEQKVDQEQSLAQQENNTRITQIDGQIEIISEGDQSNSDGPISQRGQDQDERPNGGQRA